MMQYRELSWLLVALSAFCNCIGTILLKRSHLGANNPSFLVTLISPWFIASLLTYTTGLLLFAKAIEKLPISRAVPLSQGIGFILITFLSYWLFNERLAFNQVIASSLIFAGIILITR
jgi:multidrug transporter EmrE-like cation transporter